jgi:YggT family protein
MQSFLTLFDVAINIYVWLLVASVIMSWLTSSNVINPQNGVVNMVYYFLHRITEPPLRPIRQLLPDLGKVDLAPFILILFLLFIRNLVISFYTVR